MTQKAFKSYILPIKKSKLYKLRGSCDHYKKKE